jgi:hypothetical protein
MLCNVFAWMNESSATSYRGSGNSEVWQAVFHGKMFIAKCRSSTRSLQHHATLICAPTLNATAPYTEITRYAILKLKYKRVDKGKDGVG